MSVKLYTFEWICTAIQNTIVPWLWSRISNNDSAFCTQMLEIPSKGIKVGIPPQNAAYSAPPFPPHTKQSELWGPIPKVLWQDHAADSKHRHSQCLVHDFPGHDFPGHDFPGHDFPGHDCPVYTGQNVKFKGMARADTSTTVPRAIAPALKGSSSSISSKSESKSDCWSASMCWSISIERSKKNPCASVIASRTIS